MTSDVGGRAAEDYGEAAEAASALDLLLTDAALGMLRRFRPDSSVARFGFRLARQPRTLARRFGTLAGELTTIAAGRSAIAPSRRDRRFADPAWSGNPYLRRIVQAYLAGGATAEALLADAGLGWRDTERVGFLVRNLIDAAAPSNNPLISPAAWKALIDTGGLSAVRGLRAMVSDLATPPRIPAMVAPDAFEVGRDLAVSPGAVVRRTEMCELIQYTPATPRVHRYPLVIVPPMINKYYICDLAPGRSMIGFLVSQGHQVFAISWRNPDARHRDWDLDAYGRSVAESLDAARAICGAEKAGICSLCSGGIVSAMVAAHLSQTGRLGELASLYLGVTVLDQTQEGTVAALVDDRTVALAVAASRSRGYLDGRALAEVFAWLRPNDLIWNYWVNNYLEGRPPAAFDILYWNADTTRMPAALHRDFIDIMLAGALAKPGAASMLARRWTCPRWTWTPTWWPASRITCARGSRAIAAPSCWEETCGSCCPPVGTSRPWSTHRATRRPASRWPRPRPRRSPGPPGPPGPPASQPATGRPAARLPPRRGRSTRRTPATGWRRLRPSPEAGGSTTPPGWPGEAVGRRTARPRWAARDSSRWTPRPACTSWTSSRPAR
jgi:polyhydroxyalkanoate synthase subunit PhaC